jgi:hypothetical protein
MVFEVRIMISNRRGDRQMKIDALDRPTVRPDFFCLSGVRHDRKGGVLSGESGKPAHTFARKGKDGNHAP